MATVAPGTIDTTSTSALYDSLRLYLLTYQPPDGRATLAERLRDVYRVQPPVNAVFPYAVLRLQNGLEDRAQALRRPIELETQLFHQPRAEAPALEDAADVVERALFGLSDIAGGLLTCRLTDRDTLPAPKSTSSPADAEIVQIRLVHLLRLYPGFLRPTPV